MMGVDLTRQEKESLDAQLILVTGSWIISVIAAHRRQIVSVAELIGY